MNPKIKILIVEDQTLLRESLVNLINGQSDMEVTGISGDASEAPELCRTHKPDLVLMDVITENRANGIRYAALIRRELPAIKIIAMTGLPEITFLEEARKAGIHSFLYKSAGNEHLLYVIRSTMKGIGYYPGPEDKPPFADRLTEREIALVRLIHKGTPRAGIIKQLGISEMTLKTTIKSILDKTGYDSIMEFAVYAAVNSLILPVEN